MIKTIKKLALAITVLLIALAIIGIAYERYARFNAEENFKPHGQLVDIGRHKLHYING